MLWELNKGFESPCTGPGTQEELNEYEVELILISLWSLLESSLSFNFPVSCYVFLSFSLLH